MAINQCFDPIASKEAKILILGSMPGITSLQKQEYYGHPRNAFWPIMAELFGASPKLDYQERKTILLDNAIAVWDVLQSCYRQGSLDSNIKQESIAINNFADFFEGHPLVHKLFFNGKTAEKLYKKHVIPILTPCFSQLEHHCLPSTSPAHASLTLGQKLAAWQIINIR